jgi:DNA-binding CsgD family transcriptional regulator
MTKKRLSIFLLLISTFNYAQFQFSGKVNKDFSEATAYLSVVSDCSKKDLFLTEAILQEAVIDSLGNFAFKGQVLPKKNQIYKIHIDKCNDNITDYKHLINHCLDSKEILFIANNNDTILFPLNKLNQVFCTITPSKNYNNAIVAIENLHENLYADLEFAKSDLQRKNIYKNHFLELQSFAKSFNEPLAELYAYHHYADENSFSRTAYLEDLQQSVYYKELLNKLIKNYPNTNYTRQFEAKLVKDNYPLLKENQQNYSEWLAVLAILLVFSLAFNIYQMQKKAQTNPVQNLAYKEVLTNQEQKVFELMLSNSNKEIADKLFISLSTVKTHINNIYAKLNISSRKEIAVFFKE